MSPQGQMTGLSHEELQNMKLQIYKVINAGGEFSEASGQGLSYRPYRGFGGNTQYLHYFSKKS